MSQVYAPSIRFEVSPFLRRKLRNDKAAWASFGVYRMSGFNCPTGIRDVAKRALSSTCQALDVTSRPLVECQVFSFKCLKQNKNSKGRTRSLISRSDHWLGLPAGFSAYWAITLGSLKMMRRPRMPLVHEFPEFFLITETTLVKIFVKLASIIFMKLIYYRLLPIGYCSFSFLACPARS